MSRETPAADPDRPAEPDIDDQGIDRAQIRDMLALTPEERLKRLEGFVTGILEIRALNAGRAIR
jgi:hypothetical protein